MGRQVGGGGGIRMRGNRGDSGKREHRTMLSERKGKDIIMAHLHQ